MGVVLTLLGVTTVLVGLRDMFHTLFRPSGHGSLSSLVLLGVWKLSRASGHRLGSVAGPGGMVVVITLWMLLQVLGWALVYLPHAQQGLAYSPGVDPEAYPDLLEALYLSAVTLSTLGYGDVVPTHPWVRLASPVQALTGFALLTGALAWFTQIYPPLSRRRALALRLKAHADAGYADLLGEAGPGVATRVLDSLADEITQVGIDFVQHGEGFYFREPDPDVSLPRQLPYVLRLQEAALASPDAVVRGSGRLLSSAVAQLTAQLDDNFLRTDGSPRQVLAAYAADHGQQPG